VSSLHGRALQPQARVIELEHYYEPIGSEIGLFEAAYASQIPVLLKGPTGCGKTRFIEYMAWRLKRPLITVSCHDDLTAADLSVVRSPAVPGMGVGPLARRALRRHLLSR
jgi:nitric oxide reductase NorQ protein